LAKAVNCVGNTDNPPCNKCKNCLEIEEGRSLDVIEIDAASNRGIDHIRELRESVKFSPANLKYKVYIIDEAHMLTTESFNALLKTLEEPPNYVIFILATTDVHKIPETIISRCQKFSFHKIPEAVIEKELIKILKKEGIKYEESAIKLIAKMADGALRDAESILEQAITFSEETIKEDEIRALLGIPNSETTEALIKTVISGDIKKAIDIVDEVANKETDILLWLTFVVEQLRDIIIFGKKGFENINKLYLIDFMEEIINAINMAKYYENPRLLIELAIIKITYKAKLPSIDKLIKEVTKSSLSSLPTKTEKEEKDIKNIFISSLKSKNKTLAESIVSISSENGKLKIIMKQDIKAYYMFGKNKYQNLFKELYEEISHEKINKVEVEFQKEQHKGNEMVEEVLSLFQGEIIKKITNKREE